MSTGAIGNETIEQGVASAALAAFNSERTCNLSYENRGTLHASHVCNGSQQPKCQAIADEFYSKFSKTNSTNPKGHIQKFVIKKGKQSCSR